MTFSHAECWVWDFWLADDGETYHLYYLRAPRSLGDPDLRHRNASVGHATSRDLRSWTDHGVVLDHGAPGDPDATATWTGSVVRGDDDRWWMFYTGSRFVSEESATNVETVCAAVSDDLHAWHKCGAVLSADRRWYETLDDGTWREEAWRDPWVWRGTDERWHMLLTARAVVGNPLDRGVIGHAVSDDLDHWQAMPPLSSTGAGFMHLEVPQRLESDGQTALLFSCDSPHLTGRRAGQAGGIWAVAAGGEGIDYPIEAAVRLTDERFYSGRAIRDRDGAWVLLAFENVGADGDFVGRLSDPMPLRWTQSGLRVDSVEVGA